MVVRNSAPKAKPFDTLYAKVRAGDPLTSVHAFLRVLPAIQRIKERVIAIFVEKALADLGKPWQECGLTDYELQCRANNHGSSYRTRRDELVYDERAIVFAGFQRQIGKKLCNVWRLREPGDPFYVPVPRDGVPGKPRRTTKLEEFLDGRGVTKEFADRKALDAFLKRWRFFPITEGEAELSFRDREDWVARFTPTPGAITVEITLEPYEPVGVPVVTYPHAPVREPRIAEAPKVAGGHLVRTDETEAPALTNQTFAINGEGKPVRGHESERQAPVSETKRGDAPLAEKTRTVRAPQRLARWQQLKQGNTRQDHGHRGHLSRKAQKKHITPRPHRARPDTARP